MNKENQFNKKYEDMLPEEKEFNNRCQGKGTVQIIHQWKIFFEKMKNEMFYGNEYSCKTLDDLKEAMEEDIEC